MKKSIPTRTNLFSAWCIACGCIIASQAHAQSYPTKPIHIVVGYAAGGGTDVTARMVAQKFSESLGQLGIVENRTGAGGTIAAARVASSPADGYTLLLATAADPVQSALRTNLTYNLERDFVPVSLVATGPFILVLHPSVPVRNVRELIALARSRPSGLTYGSAGVGTATHLAGELFDLMAKVKTSHVPYKGSSDAAIAAAAGQIDMGFPDATAALPLIEAGKLKAFAVTSARRAEFMPSIPTLHESGITGYDYSTWKGVIAPAGIPKEILAALIAAISKAVDTPSMKESLNKQGLDPQTSTPEKFADLIRNEIAKNAKLIKLAGIKVE